MDITGIVIAILTLCFAVLTAVIIPKLRAEVGQEKLNEALQKAETLKYYAKIAVSAAEQMFKFDSSKKLEEATKTVLNELGKNGITVNAEQVRSYIEDAVRELHAEIAYMNSEL